MTPQPRDYAAPVLMQFEVEKSAVPGKHELSFVASDETQDGYGDVVKVDGWKLDRFKANPVFLWGHDRSLPPIGSVNVARDTRPLETKGGIIQRKILRADVSFATDVSGGHGEFARSIYDLYERGYLRGVSVGFKPLEMVEPKSEEEALALGVGVRETPWGKMFGTLFKEQELLELSAVTIPANPNALKLSLSSERATNERILKLEATVAELLNVERARHSTQELGKALAQLKANLGL
jgi:hypothetical protein